MIEPSRGVQSVLLRADQMLFGVALLLSAGLSSSVLLAQDAGARSVWDGVYTTEQSQRGRTISEAGCVSCHCNQLTGNDVGPPLHGSDFRAVWTGKSAGELFDKILTTMPADGPGTLKPQQATDLVSYIFELNDFPSGMNELPSEMSPLRLVQIRSEK
jgi:mono/diheme cytochrome c family protein